jgi:hypothetical protein
VAKQRRQEELRVQCQLAKLQSPVCLSCLWRYATASTQIASQLARQPCLASASLGRPASCLHVGDRLGHVCHREPVWQKRATSLADGSPSGGSLRGEAGRGHHRGHVDSGQSVDPVTGHGGLVNVSGGGRRYRGLGGRLGGHRDGRHACGRGNDRGRRDLGHRCSGLCSDPASGHGVLATSSERGGAGSIVHGRGRTLNHQRGASPCRLVVRYCLRSVQLTAPVNRELESGLKVVALLWEEKGR